uniref:RRM domain-containing protein n=1 Tax=Strongyloides papillosus TaxID=174720 RepID=A0A0N5BXL7_STREA
MVSPRGSPMRRSRSRSPRRHQRYSPMDRSYNGNGRRHSRSYSRSPRRDRGYDDRRRSPPRGRRGGGYRDRSRSPKGYGGRRDFGNRGGGYDRRRSPRRYRDGRENPEPNNCLGIFGMSPKTQEKDLIKLFERYGRVNDVQIVYDRATGKSRGYGFIYFEKTSEAAEAKERMRDKLIDGVQVRIDFSVTKQGRTSNRSDRDRPAPRERSRSRSRD